MVDPDEIGLTVTGIADALDAMNIPWAVGGSIASATHGEPRASNDVDIIAVLTEDEARTFVARLGDRYYADADAAVDAVRHKSSFNVIDNRTFIKVDVFVPRRGPLGTGQLERAARLDVFPGARPIPVLGAEDTVLQKLRWYQVGGETSDRQWRDIVSVLKHSRDDLDDAYVEEVAKAEGLAELLQRARQQAK